MIKFGTGGWRAIIGDEFTKKNIQLVAKAIVCYVKDTRKADLPVVLGYDRRFLSREAMIWIGEVLGSNGIQVKFVNRSSPTPLIMYYVMEHNLSCGVMVTASHNPSLYNGLKIFTEGGKDACIEVTDLLERYMQEIIQLDLTSDIRRVDDLQSEGIVEFFNPINEYLDSIITKIDVVAIRDARLRIALDPLFGVSLRSLNIIFSATRCELETLHTEHDTLFAGKMPSPDEKTVVPLQNFVVDLNCDLGIATDGDADRIGLIDNNGRFIDANEILCLLYYYFLEYRQIKTPVVKNLATTCLLDKIADYYNEICYEVPVGFKNISAKMHETGAYLGGESSGGLMVMGHINGKDAIYAAALLVETIAKTGKRLSDLMEEVNAKFGCFHTVQDNISFRSERRESLVQRIYQYHEIPQMPLPIKKTSYMDGCKVYFHNGGWLLIRFSGTEPLIRIFCEMPEGQEKLALQICRNIREHFEL